MASFTSSYSAACCVRGHLACANQQGWKNTGGQAAVAHRMASFQNRGDKTVERAGCCRSQDGQLGKQLGCCVRRRPACVGAPVVPRQHQLQGQGGSAQWDEAGGAGHAQPAHQQASTQVPARPPNVSCQLSTAPGAAQPPPGGAGPQPAHPHPARSGDSGAGPAGARCGGVCGVLEWALAECKLASSLRCSKDMPPSCVGPWELSNRKTW